MQNLCGADSVIRAGGAGVYASSVSIAAVTATQAGFKDSGSLAGSLDPKVAIFENNSYAVTWRHADGRGTYTLKTRLVEGHQNPALVGTEIEVVAGLNVFSNFAVGADPSGSYSVAWLNRRTGPNGELTGDVMLRDFAASTMPPIWSVQADQPATNLSGGKGTWKYYKFVVPPNAAKVRIVTSSQSPRTVGDVDVYVSFAQLPRLAVHDGVTAHVGNEEGMEASMPQPGAYYIGLYGAEAYEDVSLTATFE